MSLAFCTSVKNLWCRIATTKICALFFFSLFQVEYKADALCGLSMKVYNLALIAKRTWQGTSLSLFTKSCIPLIHHTSCISYSFSWHSSVEAQFMWLTFWGLHGSQRVRNQTGSVAWLKSSCVHLWSWCYYLTLDTLLTKSVHDKCRCDPLLWQDLFLTPVCKVIITEVCV